MLHEIFQHWSKQRFLPDLNISQVGSVCVYDLIHSSYWRVISATIQWEAMAYLRLPHELWYSTKAEDWKLIIAIVRTNDGTSLLNRHLVLAIFLWLSIDLAVMALCRSKVNSHRQLDVKPFFHVVGEVWSCLNFEIDDVKFRTITRERSVTTLQLVDCGSNWIYFGLIQII